MSFKIFFRFLSKNPKIEAALEVLLSATLSFLPVALASLVAQFSDKEFSQAKFSTVFQSYFESGEVSLLILSACGGIVWISLVKQGVSHVVFRFFVSFFVVIASVLFIGLFLGHNPGFKNVAPKWVQNLLFIWYAALLALWFWISVTKREVQNYNTTTQRAISDPEADKADSLIRNAREKG